ncbi:ACP S-malonyltransferase [Ectothiorhodospiraceae bacterium 2226]|nr:ACP S-malonyltransferase [Ectothiorhodospiraceae bacterium 2226]
MMSLAFIFPGQGSQSVGMLAELAAAHPAVRATFDEASEVLGYDLWRIAQEDPEGRLGQTEVTQPAMLAAGVAVWRVWCEAAGERPRYMAGHSLGEYTALVCAEALAYRDAVRLVAERGRSMQAAVPAGEGAMAAILGLTDPQVEAVCRDVAQGEVVAAVNYNAPGQVVVAGTRSAVDRAVALAREAGAKRAVLLPVSVPSHCELMRPAAAQLAERLAEVAFNAPRVQVLHNADVAAHSEPGQIRDALVRQLYSPVRWVETVQRMAADGVDRVIECGPGKVLAGLNKRIDRSLQTLCVQDPATLDEALGVQA